MSHSKAGPGEGLPARRQAVLVVEDVLRRRLPLDERLEALGTGDGAALSAQDRGLVRAIATVTVRKYGHLRHVLQERLDRGLPQKSGRLDMILLTGLAQVLHMDVPDHAAVDLAVRLAREDIHARHFADLTNAVLRSAARSRTECIAQDTPEINTPSWLMERWSAAYGVEQALAIAAMHGQEPTLDLTLRSDDAILKSSLMAEPYLAEPLPTGSLRLRGRSPVTELPGFAQGQFWVQDASAALPAKLLDVKPGERVLDLCAAPGGKTAQLLAAGATVTAVDRSEPRLRRLSENMKRLGFSPEIQVADAAAFQIDPVDAILLDAPCSATGTIRRHPDVAWNKTLQDVAKLASLQARLLDHAARLLKPGGRLIYATCSLERDEGEVQIERFLARHQGFRRLPIRAEEVGGLSMLVTAVGDLRCLPCHMASEDARMAGMDGFFAARLQLHTT
jgi:16S rRNA (cytosine967-C5)-methyltransferase